MHAWVTCKFSVAYGMYGIRHDAENGYAAYTRRKLLEHQLASGACSATE